MVSGVSPTASASGCRSLRQPRSCSISEVHTSSDFESVYMPPMSSTAARRNITLVPTQKAALKWLRPGWMNR